MNLFEVAEEEVSSSQLGKRARTRGDRGRLPDKTAINIKNIRHNLSKKNHRKTMTLLIGISTIIGLQPKQGPRYLDLQTPYH